MIWSRIKMLALATLLGLVLSGGVGVYFYTKLKAETTVQVQVLESKLNAMSDSVKAIETNYVKREEVRQDIAKEGKAVRKEVRDVAKITKPVADYLSQPVPIELQSVLERAHCLQVPSNCVHSGDKGDKASDSNK